jgi:hypothetical protein
MNRVQIADLDEPSTDAFHDLPTGLESTPPVCLPLKQVARVKSVGSELEDAAKLARCSRGPKGELLHERDVLRVDEPAKLLVEVVEFRRMCYRVS